MTHNQKFTLAKIISRLFDAPIALIIIFVTIWANSSHTNLSNVYFFVTLTYLICIPIFLILLFIRIGLIDNWEMTAKSSRKYAYFLALIISFILFLLSIAFELSNFYKNFAVLAIIMSVLFGTITNFTSIKVSLHISTWTAAAILLAYYSNIWWLLLFGLLPIIGYARYYIKNHTIADMVVGFVLTSFLLTGFLVLFNV